MLLSLASPNLQLLKLMHSPQTLSFKRASPHDSSGSSAQSQHTVSRSWGQESYQSCRQMNQRCPQHFTQAARYVSPMLQRWQDESSQQQPYNGIGAFFSEEKKTSDPQNGSNSLGSGRHTSAASTGLVSRSQDHEVK